MMRPSSREARRGNIVATRFEEKSYATPERVRYAVIGAGHIAQVAVLPAFERSERSELVAIVSGDETKRHELAERYQLRHVVPYEALDELLAQDIVDAVYVAVPNHLHCHYAVSAAEHGVHVLCEKPLAVTEDECERMIAAAESHGVLLMTAYRLHFERANLEAIRILESGELGEVRSLQAVFSQDVTAGNVRLMPISKGGGSVYDMGIYCINAARYLFQDEPTHVSATSVIGRTERFAECDEMTSATLRFPGDRIATFTSSLGAASVSTYRVIGTRGTLEMEPAYAYASELRYKVVAGGNETRRTVAKRDQFGPELDYLSECIQKRLTPEPDGAEGLADVRIIRAIHHSAEAGRTLHLPPLERTRRPSLGQSIDRPGFDKPPEVHVSAPTA
jgi:predicted dehydrogenase